MDRFRKPSLEQLHQKLMLTTVVEHDLSNDARGTAQEFSIPDDGRVEIRGISDSSDDTDFYRLTASKTGELSIHVSATNGNVAQLEIEDHAGQEVFETEPNDGLNAGTLTLQQGNTYFFRLRSKEDASSEYVVNLVFQTESGGGDDGVDLGDDPRPIDADGVTEMEPNDEKSQALAIDLGENGRIQLSGVSQDSDDKDYFRFVAPESGLVELTVNGEANIAQLQVEDQAGQELVETQPNDGQNSVSVVVDAGQTYFVRLRSKNDNAAAYSADLVFQQVGDSNRDQVFDSDDLITAFQAGKYATGEPASFEDGDWNHDGVFDSDDLLFAFAAGTYVS